LSILLCACEDPQSYAKHAQDAATRFIISCMENTTPLFGGLLIALFALNIIASLLEAGVLAWRASRGKGPAYDWAGLGVSFADLVVRNILRVVLPAGFIAVFGTWLWEHRIFTIPLSSFAAFALLFIGQEFCHYWYHRASHRVRWLWLSHSIHHSTNNLNLSAAYRLSWTSAYTGGALFFLPLIWLGFPVRVALACLALNLLYQFWLHATWIPKLGWLEYVLNTPSSHRVHHGANLEYLDGNYGGALIIFDRLFGTYIPEREDLPIRYGWVEPLLTNNVFLLQATPWIRLFHDLRGARSPSEVLGLLLKPPGWRPASKGPGRTTEDLRRAAGLPQ
jgi:sterol desaturase/sphingolipid hydroxylase (fatty acid hydroxylase superfamily)